MPKIQIPKIEVYITNSCNFNCDGCNSISNFNVPNNHLLWRDHADAYSKWAKILDLGFIGIIGGEPLSNPDYPNWLLGLRQIWPDKPIGIATNGSLLGKKITAEFYDLCYENNILIFVSLHNKNSFAEDIDRVKSWLKGAVNFYPYAQSRAFQQALEGYHKTPEVLAKNQESYIKIKDPSWPDCRSVDDWNNLPSYIREECINVHNFTFKDTVSYSNSFLAVAEDVNGVKVVFSTEWSFTPGIVTADTITNTFQFQINNAEAAFDVCEQKYCYQFYKGKLYKCAPTHVFKDIVDNFDTNLSNNDIALIQNYSAATVDMPAADIQKFIDNFKHPVEQCKFCPTSSKRTFMIGETGKKIFVLKKGNVA